MPEIPRCHKCRAVCGLAIEGGQWWCPDCLWAEIEWLRAIVDKLPKTADGVPVVPGMRLYFGEASLKVSKMVYDLPNEIDGAQWAMAIGVPFAKAYSTREAVEAGGKNGNRNQA